MKMMGMSTVEQFKNVIIWAPWRDVDFVSGRVFIGHAPMMGNYNSEYTIDMGRRACMSHDESPDDIRRELNDHCESDDDIRRFIKSEAERGHHWYWSATNRSRTTNFGSTRMHIMSRSTQVPMDVRPGDVLMFVDAGLKSTAITCWNDKPGVGKATDVRLVPTYKPITVFSVTPCELNLRRNEVYEPAMCVGTIQSDATYNTINFMEMKTT